NHKAYVRYVNPDYYTEAMTYVKVHVLEVEGTSEARSPEPSSRLAGASSRSSEGTSEARSPEPSSRLAGASSRSSASEARLRNAISKWGQVQVVEKVVGYKKIKFFTHENT